MKIKVNNKTQLKIYKDSVKKVLETGIVRCFQVDCQHEGIQCEHCQLNATGPMGVKLEDIIVKENEKQVKFFMTMSSELAKSGVVKGAGGPFGSVVVKDGIIVGMGHNTVIRDNDPTAHGEMNAIRDASKRLGTFDLTGCELYTSSEPCPMCLSAIMWANIKKVYYGCTVKDAERIGFRDVFIYEWLETRDSEVLDLECVGREECLKGFDMWQNKVDKKEY